jgi:hypothetical protein
MQFIPQWAWVLSNLWYLHSPTRTHVIKIVIFTVKTMMWMFTHQPAPPWTLPVWEHLLTLLASYSMFGLLKRSMRFGGSREWYLNLLVMASCCSGGCRSKVHLWWNGNKVDIWKDRGILLLFNWLVLSIIDEFPMRIWCINLSKISLEMNMNYMY